MAKECGLPCEVYSRVVGYMRPVGAWNAGKLAEYSERVPFVAAPRDPPEPRTVTVDGNSLAELAQHLLQRLEGRWSDEVHTEADWLRTNGHEMAGEILEVLSTARDSIASS